ncbi:MAG: Jag N-terminal domain-containing protein, partial [Candidatus Adiutrix sp.]|nr:Jag N-terminal domain-containing protein [Candidatus Adiutrix sp.]
MTVEFTGRDLAEAIAAAAEALNLPPEKLKFSVVAMGAKGFLGLGRRRARIAVDPADPTLYPPEEEEEPAPPVPAPPASAPPVQAALAAPQAPAKKARPGKPAPAAGVQSPPFPDYPPPLTRPAAGETREDNPDDETARLARAVVTDILGRLGLAADMTLVRLGSRL